MVLVMDLLRGLLGSQSRAEILRLLFNGRDQEFYLRDLERRTGLLIRSVQYEMANLLKMDLVEERRDGNRRYFSANRMHPLYEDICQIVLKTSGWVLSLKHLLARPDVVLAFVFGSIASGEERAESDIDVMVIGDIGLRELTALTGPLARKTGRPINGITYTVREFSRRIKVKEHFISTVLASPRLYLIGSEDDIVKLGS